MKRVDNILVLNGARQANARAELSANEARLVPAGRLIESSGSRANCCRPASEWRRRRRLRDHLFGADLIAAGRDSLVCRLREL